MILIHRHQTDSPWILMRIGEQGTCRVPCRSVVAQDSGSDYIILTRASPKLKKKMRDNLHKEFGDDFCIVTVATIVGYVMHLQNLWHIYIDVDACYNWPVDSYVFMQF